jgi:hypothetical protein
LLPALFLDRADGEPSELALKGCSNVEGDDDGAQTHGDFEQRLANEVERLKTKATAAGQ